MASDAEPAKLLLPYLQRADELQKHDPLVAYYCRLYAMERGLKIPPKERTKTTSALLVSLIKQLEKDKKSIKLGPEDNLYVEGFASTVFAKADKQDRAGRADLNTAKTFYAASIFFEILSQFGEIQPDIEQKQKYALWKAAEIRKALKEGRRPEPGPPGGENDISSPSSSPTSTHDLGPTEGFPASRPGGATTFQQVDKDIGRSESFQTGYPGSNIPSQYEERANPHVLPQAHPSASSYPNYDYSNTNIHPPSLVNKPEIPSTPEPYHHQSYLSEQQSIPQNYYSHENPTASFPYPNFQSYPSFNDSTFPTTPSHQPQYHGPDASYANHATPSDPNYPSKLQYDSTSRNGNHATTPSPPAATFNYDINYQPPPEKIAGAHKAARFAVGALAFDDVTVAVDFLRKSLELLTNPSAQSH